MKKKIMAWLLSTAVVLTPFAQSNVFAAGNSSVESSEQYLDDTFLSSNSAESGASSSVNALDGEDNDEFDVFDDFDPDEGLSDTPDPDAADTLSEDSDDQNAAAEGSAKAYEGSSASDEPQAKTSEDPDEGISASEDPDSPGTEDPEQGVSEASDPEVTDVPDPDEGKETGSGEDSPESGVISEDPDAPAEPIEESEEDDEEEIIDEEAEDEDAGEEKPAGYQESEEYFLPKEAFYIIDSCMSLNNNLSLTNTKPGEDFAEGVKAVISDSVTDCNVYWEFVKNDDESYRILSFESGYALTASGSDVVQKAYTGADTQKWYFRRYEGKSFTSLSPASAPTKRLALAGKTSKYAAAGSKLVLAEHGANYQMWYLKKRTSPQVSVEDGTYYISSSKYAEKAIYVSANSRANDASVVLYKWLGRRGQWFTLKSLGKGNLYTISNTYSGKFLYPKGGKKTSGTPIVQYTASDSLAQAWRLVPNGDYYQLEHVSSGLSLGLTGKKYLNNTTLELQNSTGAAYQLWSFVPFDTVGKDTQGKTAGLAKGYYRLTTAADSSLVATVTNASKKTGAGLSLAPSTAKEKATFYLRSLGSGKYAIYSFCSWKYVGVNYDNAENNYKVVTKDDYSADSSKWYIRKSTVDSSQLSIVNAANTALVLTFDGSCKSGAALKISYSTGDESQRWTAAKMANQKPLTDGQRYVLASQLNTGLVMSVENKNQGTGSIFLRNAEKQPWEVYIFEYVGPNNIYKIRNQWSGKVLTSSGGTDSDAVKLANDKDYKSQYWHVRAMGSARYIISNVKTGNILTVANGAAADGAGVVAAKENNKSSQLWVMHKATTVEKVPTNINICISPKGTNNVVEVKDGSMVDRTPIQFGTASSSTQQVFQIVPSGSYFKIRNVATGRYITSSNGKATSRPSISSKAQLWKVFPEGNRYYFKNVGNSRYLTTNDAAYSAGTQLVVSSNKMVSLLYYTSVTGWQYVNGGMRYYNSNNTYKTNEFLNYNGKLVYVNGNGLVHTGWLKYGAYYYYFNGTAGQVKNDARPYIGILYPQKRAGIHKSEYLGPNCSYRITVDRQYPCLTTVYTQYPGQSEYNVPVVSYLCSPGADGTPTAAGERVTIHSARWQELMGPSYGQFGMAILYNDPTDGWIVNGDFFHSLACGEPNDHNLDPNAYNMLGNRASHGCVRLNVRNAYWQYNFILDNTHVYVGDNLARPLNAIAQPYANSAIDPTDPFYTGNYGYTENGVYYNPAGFH